MATELGRHIRQLDFSIQINTVKDLLQNAHAKTTFWGNRVVEVQGFSGSVYLDDLARKTLDASEKCRDEGNWEQERCLKGREIVSLLKDFYRTTDGEFQNSNCFTRLLNWLLEFDLIPYYTARFWLEDITSDHFNAG